MTEVETKRVIGGLPALTNELIRRFEVIDALHAQQRMEGIRAQKNNPFGIEIGKFGRAIALKASELPSHFFNHVVGLGVPEQDLIGDLLQFYGTTPFAIELLPNDINESLADKLTAHGFRHTQFHAGLFGSAESDDIDDFVEIEKVENPEQFSDFLDTNFHGYEIPVSIKEQALSNMQHWIEIPNWHLYLARVEDEPAASAILQVGGDLGYLASAATLPGFRKRGLQTALIRRRIAEAEKLGCRLVCSQAQFGSSSFHNLETAGLRLAYLKAIWTRQSV